MLEKNFDVWNTVKKTLDKKEIDWDLYFHEREIWWCSLGLNVGVESDGKHDYFERPVLLLRIFNKEMIWGLPITSTVKDSPFYHRFKFMDSDRSVMLTQVRTISAKRLRRKVDVIADADFEAIKCALCLLIKSETPALKRGNLGGRSH